MKNAVEKRKSAVQVASKTDETNSSRLTDLGPSGTAAGSESSSDERLSGSWRSVEEHTSRRGDLEAEEELGVEKRERDHLFELLNVFEVK